MSEAVAGLLDQFAALSSAERIAFFDKLTKQQSVILDKELHQVVLERLAKVHDPSHSVDGPTMLEEFAEAYWSTGRC
jgi:hypothetical protein